MIHESDMGIGLGILLMWAEHGTYRGDQDSEIDMDYLKIVIW